MQSLKSAGGSIFAAVLQVEIEGFERGGVEGRRNRSQSAEASIDSKYA